MKFHCDRCKTRYSISEEKIRGKVLKIRCKNCSAIITVREGQQAVTEKGSQVAAAPAGRAASAPANGAAKAAGAAKPASSALGDAFARAMEQGPDQADDGASGGRGDTENEDESTRMAPPPSMFDDEAPRARAAGPGAAGAATSAPPSPFDIEWFVSVDGEQEGPFNLQEAQRRVARKRADEEMFAWQEGFDDWLPVEQVPELSPHLPRMAPPARARSTAPPIPADAGFAHPGGMGGAVAAPMAASASAAASAAAAGARAAVGQAAGAESERAGGAAPLSLAALASSESTTPPPGDGGDNMDFEIGEASRVVKLPMLVPPGMGGAAGAAGAAAGAAARSPGASGSLPGMVVPAGARGTGGMAAVGQVLPADANLAAAVLQPSKRPGHGMLFLIGGGALAAIAVVLVIVLVSGGGRSGGDELAAAPESTFLEGFYDTAPEIATLPNAPKQPDPEEDKGSGKSSQIKKIVPKKNPGNGGGVTDPIKRPGNGEDIADPTAGGGVGVRDRQAEEVLQARQRYGGALQQCWERALKLNPDLKRSGVRLDVQLTIAANGRVGGVTVNGGGNERDLRECVRQRVSGWQFVPARNDFTTQVTLSFN